MKRSLDLRFFELPRHLRDWAQGVMHRRNRPQRRRNRASALSLGAERLEDRRMLTGGVVTGLSLWLKADAGTATTGTDLTAWTDQSASSVTVSSAQTNHPQLVIPSGAGEYNFNNSVDFTSTLTQLEATGLTTLLPVQSQAGSIFAVSRKLANVQTTFIYKNANGMGNGVVGLFQQIGVVNDFSSLFPDTFPSNETHITGLVAATAVRRGLFDGDLANNGGLQEENFESMVNEDELSIGSNSDGTDQFTGSLAELIVYDRTLSDAEAQVVNSYLAVKYGVTLQTDDRDAGVVEGDYVASDLTTVWDSTANSVYHNDVAGIARDDASELDQRISQSVNSDALVTIDNGGAFSADTSFLMWGNDDGSTSLGTAVGGSSLERMGRIWTVDETGTVGTVTLSIPQSAFSSTSPTLLRSTDETFDSGDTQIALADDGNGNFTATIDFADGDFFTFAQTAPAAPGGVSTSLTLWLKADAGTSTTGSDLDAWTDQSATGLTVTSAETNDPQLVIPSGAGEFNFNNTVDFTTGLTRLAGTFDGLVTSGDAAVSFFAVTNKRADGSNTFNYRNNDGGSNNTIGLEQNQGYVRSQTVQLVDTFPLNETHISGIISQPGTRFGMFDGDVGPGGTGTVDGALDGKTTEDVLSIGAFPDGSSQFQNFLAELVIYDRTLDPAEVQIVNSYLAVKYGVTLQTDNRDGGVVEGDYVAADGTVVWDFTANSFYHNDVAGIARDDASVLDQRISLSNNSDALVTVDNGGAFSADQSFLLWGNDDGSTSLGTAISGSSLERMGRLWTVEETGTVGTVTLSIPQSAFSTTSPTLLRSTDETFDNGDEQIALADDGNGNFTATIDFADGDFFTFAQAAPDGQPPTLDSFTRQTPPTSPTSANTLVFRATFDEDVQNVGTADFVVNSTSTATVTNVNPVSASVYDITVSGGDLAGFNGTVGIDLAGGQDIQDLAGNALPAGEPATDEMYVVANVGVTVINAGPGDNDIIVTRDGGDLVVTVDGVEVHRDLIGSTTELVVNGEGGDDRLTVDVSNGNPFPVNGISFAGGETNEDGVGDQANIIGYDATDVTYTPTGTEAGTIDIDGDVLTFTESESVGLLGMQDNLDVDLTMTGAANGDIVLSDDGGANDPDGMNDADTSSIEGSTIPYTQFTNPTVSLDVPLGDMGDTITMDPMDATFMPTAGTKLTGGDGADTFNITPDDDSPIDIDGNNPTVDPGDVLNVDVAGVTNPLLTPGATSDTGTVSGDNVGDVTFQEIEELNILNGPIDVAPIMINGGDNDVVVSRDGDETVVTVDGVEVFRAATDDITDLPIDTDGGDDTVTVDFSGGDPIPAGGLDLSLGETGETDGDQVIVTGYDAMNVSITPTSEDDGTIDIDGKLITFTDSEAVDLDGMQDNLDVDLTQTGAANGDILLSDDGGANDPDGMNDADTSAIEGSTIPFIQFTNPTDSLDVPLGDMGDTITMDPMDATFMPTAGTKLTGGDGADTFNITPDDDSPIDIDGNDPSVDPGDVLNVDVAGVTNPLLTPGATSDAGTVSGDNVGDVTFQEIEELNIIGGPIDVAPIMINGGDNDVVVSKDGDETVVTVDGVEVFRAATDDITDLPIDTDGGDDTVTVDFSGGDPIPAGGLDLSLGETGETDGDQVIVTGYDAMNVSITPTSEDDGTIDIDGKLITFTDSEAVALDGMQDNLDVDLTQTGAANSDLLLGDDGGANDPDGMNDADTSAIEGSTIPFIQFTNPTDSLDVPLGDMGDTITMDPMDATFMPTAGTKLTGGDGADTFNITPDDDSTIDIDGNNPTVDPGDVLNVDVAGVTNPLLTPGGTPDTGTVSGDNVGDVTFQEIEEVNLLNAVGPGGLTAPLAFWLKADDGTSTTTDGASVATWTDQSSNGYIGNSGGGDGETEPTFRDNAGSTINFNPVVDFDGLSNGVSFGSQYLFSENDGLSVIAVAAPDGPGAIQLLFDFGQTQAHGYGIAFSQDVLSGYSPGAFGGTAQAFDPSSDGTPAIVANQIEFGTQQSLWLDGDIVVGPDPITLAQLTGAEIQEAPTHELDFGPVTVGRQSKARFSDTRKFDGRIAEVIVLDDQVSAADWEKVQSYLAVKYGITLGGGLNYVDSSGAVAWDSAANAAYHNDVAGIGRDDASALNQSKSKSVDNDALVTIDNPVSFDTDGSFLLWGNNDGSTLFDTISGSNQHMGRIWHVQESGTLGSVTVSIPDSVEAISLLVDDDGDFSSGATTIPLTSAAGELTADVDFADGQFFTFAGLSEDSFLVTTAVDENDGMPDPSMGAGTSLREAIIAANANPNRTTITFDPSLDGTPITLSLRGIDNTAALGDLDVTQRTIIQGNGARNTIIDAAGAGGLGDRVFHIFDAGDVTLSGVAVTGGVAKAQGAGIRSAGAFVLVESSVSGNQAGKAGGGIFSNGTATIVSSLISGNVSTFSGGGGLHGTDVTIDNSTVSGNMASGNGGGIYNDGSLTAANVTIAANSAAAGGGIFNNGSMSIDNSIVTLSTGDDCAGGGVASGSNNLSDDDATCVGTVAAVTNFDATLRANGGPTDTHALLAGSNAVDAGDNALAPADSQDLNGDMDTGQTIPFDQRGMGFDRIVNGTVDIGAFEAVPSLGDSFLVTTAVDENDGMPDPGMGAGTSLREAVIAANANPNMTTITFDPSLDGTPITLSLGGIDNTAALGDLDVTQRTIIQGNGARNTIIDAGGAGGLGDRVFHIFNAGDVTLSGVTVTGGDAKAQGAGIRNNASLVLVESSVSGNQAGKEGGGIFSDGTATIVSSLISDNTSTFRGGGGLHGSDVTIVNSTVSGNTASGNGGGIYNDGSLTAANLTLASNSAAAGGGIFNFGSLELDNSVITLSTGDDYAGAGEAGGSNNLSDDFPGAAAAVTNFDATLGDNGGPTDTHALLAGSNAIDAGDNTKAPADSQDLDGDLDTGETIPFDQRGMGFDRIVNGTVDIGAFEADSVEFLLAAGGEATGGAPLSAEQLAPIVDAAIQRLTVAGVVTDPSSIDISIADLPGAALGFGGSTSIVIDVDAAGHGWYVDLTPLDDAEFSNPQSAFGNPQSIDLLTAVMHELGHTAGLADLHDAAAEDDLMYGWLEAGVRKTSLEASLADDAFAGF